MCIRDRKNSFHDKFEGCDCECADEGGGRGDCEDCSKGCSEAECEEGEEEDKDECEFLVLDVEDLGGGEFTIPDSDSGGCKLLNSKLSPLLFALLSISWLF